MVRSRGYHYESSLLTCTVKEEQNRRFLLRRFILLWWDLLFTRRRFVLLRYKLQINLRYNTIFWNTYKWLLIIILRERVVWRAIFSFVISFEISKLTSSFVNFNDLTKLIYGKKIGAQYFSQSLRTKSFGSSFEIEKIRRKLRLRLKNSRIFHFNFDFDFWSTVRNVP